MKSRWSRPIVILHWISAIAIVGMFASGLWMVDLTYYSDWYKTAPHWHKSVGLILLAITVIRLVTRVVTSRPPSHGTPLEKKVKSHRSWASVHLDYHAIRERLFNFNGRWKKHRRI